ncbi:winged helix-turn-helix domain-containing protein [Ochrobactrum soli]|uniref:Winged helix-turn-helix transcriptional regulator n=1 Tax=Ochrobactrum soli TaxID=2448455 RepID=A0A849KLY2_9HYPH|nr:winged helix-turn-helix transcriptional regulator [[Ochrobactrum] soli]
MNSGDRIVHLTLDDEILIRWKNLIHNGDLKSGDKIPSERELARRYGIARVVVRNALQALSREGLICPVCSDTVKPSRHSQLPC